jgi:hypothetical protein
MDIDTIKPFINHQVEIFLEGGQCIEGILMPIVKGVILVHPLEQMAAFYGSAVLCLDKIIGIRQLKQVGPDYTNEMVGNEPIPNLGSAFDNPTKLRFNSQKSQR